MSELIINTNEVVINEGTLKKDVVKKQEVKEDKNILLLEDINYALAYQKFRGELNSHIAAMQQRIPIPTYMVEGILAGILADVRSAVISENSLECNAFRENLDKYYEDREKELNDEILKLKAKNEEKA